MRLVSAGFITSGLGLRVAGLGLFCSGLAAHCLRFRGPGLGLDCGEFRRFCISSGLVRPASYRDLAQHLDGWGFLYNHVRATLGLL